MKGLVFSQFIDMVEERFGPDLLERIIGECQLPSGGVYSSLGTYDFEELAQLVGALSRESGLPPGALIRAFGMFLFGRLVKLYPQFIDGETSTMGFVPKVENYIHHEVRKLYPDATLPQFIIEDVGPDRLVFVYQSQRPLSDLAEGMLLACVGHFEEDIELQREDLPTDVGARARFSLTRMAPETIPELPPLEEVRREDGAPVARRRWSGTAALAAEVAAVLPAPVAETSILPPETEGELEGEHYGELEGGAYGESQPYAEALPYDESQPLAEAQPAAEAEQAQTRALEAEQATPATPSAEAAAEPAATEPAAAEPAAAEPATEPAAAEPAATEPAAAEPAAAEPATEPAAAEPATEPAAAEPATEPAAAEPAAAEPATEPAAAEPATEPAAAEPAAAVPAPAPPAPAPTPSLPLKRPTVDEAGLDRTLGYLRGVLLDRAVAEISAEAGPDMAAAIAHAGADIERTLGVMRRTLLAPPAPAHGMSPSVRQQIEQLESRLKRATEIRKSTEAISEQKTNELYKAKSEIENALGYLRAILDNMDDGLLVVALDGEIKLVNRRAQHLFGLEGLELLGMAVDNVFNERMVTLVERCMTHPTAASLRMDITSPAGQPLSVVANAIRAGDAAKHIGTVMIVRDISAEVEAQKHRSITDMVVGMAHELNTPLGIIKTAVGIISEAARSEVLSTIDDESVQEELESVVGATELIDGHTTRMGRLIEAFKKLSASQMTEAIVDVDLLELLQEISEVMVSTDDRLQVQVACELEPMDRQWLGQPDHLTQVITALLANVAEHAYPGGSDTFPVKLTLDRDDSREVFVIGVRDFGVGMAHEQMLRIFDPFFTSKRGGGGASPGLGLSIVNNLVRAGLRGSIEVSSDVGNGTTFVVKVPLRLG